MARRLAEGKTRKEIIRCLKLYVAREVHRAILTDLAPQRPAENPHDRRLTSIEASNRKPARTQGHDPHSI